MSDIKRVAIDTSKSVFTIHAVDARDRPVLRRNLRRQDMAPFFAKLPPADVAIEACGASHHWARTLQGLGHRVRLIPAQYVKPFVKRGKNDRNDAEAISEAAARPGMRSVPVKSADRQAGAIVLSVRELLVGQRTQLVNALRGHAAEFGLVTRPGNKGVTQLLADVASDGALPAAAKEGLALLGSEIGHLEAQLAEIEAKLAVQHKATPMSQLLAAVPGIGPISALSLVLRVDAGQFETGRHFASWLGLTPRDHSTGGKQRLGGISRAGNERLRQLLVLGATAVIRYAKPGPAQPDQNRSDQADPALVNAAATPAGAAPGTKKAPARAAASAWLLSLLERRPRKVAAVALANKMARIVWAMMTRGEAYRQPKAVA